MNKAKSDLVRITGNDPQGKKFKSTAVYDKQLSSNFCKPHQSLDIADERTDELAAAFEQILASTAPADKPEPKPGAKGRSGKAARK
jgi:hypothetical protein